MPLNPAVEGDPTMRVMVLVKATEDSEKGILPTTEMFEASDGDELIVFVPGTDYVAIFYRATPSELLAKSHAGHEGGSAPMTRAVFHGRAWQAANAKARELGWIV
jgi:hypothetical protein